jgi:Adenylate cyclase, family 3 (some proteins contain HAMP domain)
MGFGLHVGWAIEGAIGSEYKIDASYLSPNVNMASRLEAATKQYGVPILISGELYKLATSETKKHMRHIDRVTVKGSVEPMGTLFLTYK